jgi:hypothetical protein
MEIMPTELHNPAIHQALLKLDAWVARADWKAYDPFDGLASPYARALTFGRPFLKQVWQQGVRRFPMNLRPILGIKPSMSTKGMGFFAQGYLRLYQAYGEKAYLEKMRFCLRWLGEKRIKKFNGFCWGNHFDYAHRAGSIPKETPTIVWTGLIGHAFMDAYEALGEWGDLEVAKNICEFITTELGISEFENTSYLHYYPGATHFVHNSNMIGASLLARVNHSQPPFIQVMCLRLSTASTAILVTRNICRILRKGIDSMSKRFLERTAPRATMIERRVPWIFNVHLREFKRSLASGVCIPRALNRRTRSPCGLFATCKTALAISIIGNTRLLPTRLRPCIGARRQCLQLSRCSSSAHTQS